MYVINIYYFSGVCGEFCMDSVRNNPHVCQSDSHRPGLLYGNVEDGYVSVKDRRRKCLN